MKEFIPFAATITHKEKKCKVFVNADGSVHVEDWDFLNSYYLNCVGYASEEFVILTLLLAARGKLKEVPLNIVKAIAMATAIDMSISTLDPPIEGKLH